MNLPEIKEVCAVHTWREYGDVETLVQAIEELNGRAPGPELTEAIVAALRGEKPRKRTLAMKNRDRDYSILIMVGRLQKFGIAGTQEEAFCILADWYSLSSHTIEQIYKRERTARTKG